jgi:hypothetical protein
MHHLPGDTHRGCTHPEIFISLLGRGNGPTVKQTTELMNEGMKETTKQQTNERNNEQMYRVNETALHNGILTGAAHYYNIQELYFLKFIAVNCIEIRHKRV